MTEINWSLPLETDEPTPRHVVRKEATDFPGYWCSVASGVDWTSVRYAYLLDGTPYNLLVPGAVATPKIRNVRALRTSDECLQRMEALVRRMAGLQRGGFIELGSHEEERDAAIGDAREIVKMLPAPPVDPDMIEARKILHASGGLSGDPLSILDGSQDKSASVALVLSALQRGRELAANGQ